MDLIYYPTYSTIVSPVGKSLPPVATPLEIRSTRLLERYLPTLAYTYNISHSLMFHFLTFFVILYKLSPRTFALSACRLSNSTQEFSTQLRNT